MAQSEDTSFDPAKMLALAESQQRTVEGKMAAFVPLILLGWGIAWLAGFLVLWGDALARGGEGSITAWAGVTFALLLVGAGVLSTILGIRSSRGVKATRAAAVIGIVYGNSWWVGSVAIMMIGQALVRAGMDGGLLSVFYPSAYIFFAGIMYVMSGLLWQAYPMMVLGLWSIVVAAVGAFLPSPSHYLLYALAGGGAFILVAGWAAWWARAARRRVSRIIGGAS